MCGVLIALARSLTRTLERVDARQVDVSHVGNVGKVVTQHKLSAVVKVDGIVAMLEADVADKANNAAGEAT